MCNVEFLNTACQKVTDNLKLTLGVNVRQGLKVVAGRGGAVHHLVGGGPEATAEGTPYNLVRAGATSPLLPKSPTLKQKGPLIINYKCPFAEGGAKKTKGNHGIQS